jgi:hypothetical protein
MVLVHLKNRISEFRIEILSIKRSKGHQNILKVSDKKNAFFLRCWIYNKFRLCQHFPRNSQFLKIQYLKKNAFLLSETFRVFWWSLDFLIDKISSRNSLIRFFRWTSAIEQKSSKPVITEPHRRISPNPRRVILVSGPLLIPKI